MYAVTSMRGQTVPEVRWVSSIWGQEVYKVRWVSSMWGQAVSEVMWMDTGQHMRSGRFWGQISEQHLRSVKPCWSCWGWGVHLADWGPVALAEPRSDRFSPKEVVVLVASHPQVLNKGLKQSQLLPRQLTRNIYLIFIFYLFIALITKYFPIYNFPAELIIKYHVIWATV